MNTRTTAFAALFALATAGMAAEANVSAPLLYLAGDIGAPDSVQPPLRVSETLAPGAGQTIASAFDSERSQIADLARWNTEVRTPARNGFSRELSQSIHLRATSSELDHLVGRTIDGGWLAGTADSFVWGTAIEAVGAYRLRLELKELHLPRGTSFWVWGEGEEPLHFGPENIDETGSLWTPSVSGPVIHLEVSWPRDVSDDEIVALRIDRLLQIFELNTAGEAIESNLLPMNFSITSCLLNAACVTDAQVPNISLMKKSVAHLQYVQGGNGYVCSGNLLNNTSNDHTPYLLTANHCIDTQATAGTLEAFWDYIISGCPGTTPSLSSLPRSTGSTLLAHNPTSDFALLRLSNLPGNRVFLGWTSDSAATTSGTLLPRLHHPLGFPMNYSESVSWNPPGTCNGLPTNNFLYSNPAPEVGDGVTMGGSSGSSVLLLNGQVVGQLFGWCGPNVDEPCLAGAQDSNVDGRFSSTYASIAQYLNPSTSSGPCVQNATTLCLLGDRFEVKATYTDYSNNTGPGHAVELTPDSGYFWFFDASNVEAVGKVVSFCPVNGSFGFYAGGLTDVGVVMTVRDTVANQTQTFTNNRGHNFNMISSAFNTCQ